MRLLAIIFSNGATSLVSLMLTVVIARQDGPNQLGVFGVAFAVIALTQLFAREVGLNRALSSPDDTEYRQIAFARASLVALVVAIPMIIIGIILWVPIVIITGVALPGHIIFAFLRLLTMTDGRMRRGFVADATLIGSVAIASLTVILLDVTSLVVLGTWALLLPLSSALLVKQLGLRLKPGWHAANKHYTGVSFGIQNLFGSGAVQMSTFILAGLFGPGLVGAIRGASTVLGPINMVTTSVGTLAIRELATAEKTQRRKTMLIWFGIPTGIATAGAIVTWLGMSAFGAAILGESWSVAEPLIPWVALDAALFATAVAARSAHRVDERGAAAWKVSITSGVVRLLLLPAGGFWAGALGVAMASAVTALISAGLWWVSYMLYRRQAPRARQRSL